MEARARGLDHDPFQFVEKDGYFYGRGTQDMKDGDAIMMTTLIRMKKEGYRADRDIILALTADEEGGTSNGVDWLLKNRRDLVDAEFVLNHDGGGLHRERQAAGLQASGYREGVCGLLLHGTNPGGHSSRPRRTMRSMSWPKRYAHRQYEFPVRAEQRHAGVLREHGEDRQGERAADMAAILKTPPDKRLWRASQRPGGPLEHAHYLRSHAARRRARQQRAASAGRRRT